MDLHQPPRRGQQVADRRLGRVIYFDARSREYPVRELTQGKLPRSYTWRCNQHLDQGSEGSCVGFGCTHELIARPAEAEGLAYDYAYGVYKEAQTRDPWEGENYEGTAVLAGVETLRKRGWIDGYYWAFTFEDLVLGLGYKGPAVLGIKWMDGMFNTDSAGYIHATGPVRGGHCILCKSVSLSKERFTLHNSWGTSWGINGDAYISFIDMKSLLYDEGEAVFFVGRHNQGTT